MADVAHTSVGYVGTVDQVAEAKRFGGVALPFLAAGSTNWAVTVSGTTNRTVNIAAGTGQAYGVRDSTSAQATLTAAANASGSTRYDVVVATFNWAAGTPATSFQIIQGTTSGIPTINTGGSVVSGQINRIPGVQYDALLGVLQVRNGVGLLASTDLFDSRLYGGLSGQAVIPNATYIVDVHAGPGTEVLDASTGQRWRFDGSAWGWPRSAQGVIAYIDFASAGGAPITLSNTNSILTIYSLPAFTVPANRRLRIVHHVTLQSTGGATCAYGFNYELGGTIFRTAIHGIPFIDVPQTQAHVYEMAPSAGSIVLTVNGYRQAGTGTPQLMSDNGSSTGLLGPTQFFVEDIGAAS